MITIQYYLCFLDYIYGNTLKTTKYFSDNLPAKTQIYSFYLTIKYFNDEHYRHNTLKKDLLLNLDNVYIPNTYIKFSYFCCNKFMLYVFFFFVFPILCFFDKGMKKQLTEPDDWFTYWRHNCMVNYHYYLHNANTRQEFKNEDKYLFHENVFDTMLAHYVISPEGSQKLDVLSENYLNHKCIPIEDVIGKKGVNQMSMIDIPVENVYEYACEDADITLRLKNIFAKEIEKKGYQKLFYEIEIPLLFVLANIEQNGVKIDSEFLKKMSGSLSQKIKDTERLIFETSGEEFNVGSPKQLGIILFDKLKITENPKKTKSGQYSTSEDVLNKLSNEHEIVEQVLSFREFKKLQSTYVDALPDMVSKTDGLIHTDYAQAVTATGRLSSNNPNLQNIPIRTDLGRKTRQAFIPRYPKNIILAADYSQIELRIIAEFSKDRDMISAFKENKDIHSLTAAKVFKVDLDKVTPDMRRRAKEVNFGIIYGISAFGLSQNLNIPRSEAKEIIDSYFEEFKSIKEYMDNSIEKARKNKYVETIFGRRRYLRDIDSRNFTLRGFAERNAINSPIQGSAADIIKLAMIKVLKWINDNQLKSKMIMQVHDELVFDIHNQELDLFKKNIKSIMENVIETEVPLKVDIGHGKNWLEAH